MAVAPSRLLVGGLFRIGVDTFWPGRVLCVVVRQPEAADVAGPRPREVGGACRRQVLAGARTQETVGGPNGAQRSEFRRIRLPAVYIKYSDMSWPCMMPSRISVEDISTSGASRISMS